MTLICLRTLVFVAVSAHAGLGSIPKFSVPNEQAIEGAAFRAQVEEDWLRQAEALELRSIQGSITQKDARGGCDGVKNGKYGFHTAQEANPWWQVDLGKAESISRINVFNRLDYTPGLHNADHLRILISLDLENWEVIHENKGIHFGGITGAKPLSVELNERTIQARYLRLHVPSDKPIFFHLDEVEIFGPRSQDKNLALGCPTDQSSASQWSTTKALGASTRPKSYPSAEFMESARKLASDWQKQGLNIDASELEEVAQRMESLPEGAPEEERRKLYLEARWAIRRLVFSNPLLDFDQLLFVKRFTQETYPDICLNHMPWVSRPGGDLCILTGPNGKNLFSALGSPDGGAAAAVTLRNVLNRALGPGHVHGMDLSWEGNRIVFGYARARSHQPPAGWLDRAKSYELRRGEEPIHIFEVGVDGTNLRQLTDGEWSDLDPTYAPNGEIVFVSERCGTSLQCNEYDKDETSCNLYVMGPDGGAIRRLSVNKDGDYLPHTLDDGTMAYTRWEYHERSFAYIQSIWTIRPDGTGADALFKQHFMDPWALEDTRSIPGSKKLVSIAAGHHTLATGPLVIIDPSVGINEAKGISIVTPDVKPLEGGMDGIPVPEGGVRDYIGFYSTPWALSEKHFLVSYTYSEQQTDPTGYALYLVDVFGNKELIYKDPTISSFIPIPLRPRSRPPVLTEQMEPCTDEATCIVSGASFGSVGITPEQVGYIRIAEPIGWPYDNELGGQRYGEDHRYGGPEADKKNLLSWTPVRIIGDVPLESDGSAHFKVPSDRAVYFQLLDKDRMELRRMRSFISFQPGEVRSCVGCHESDAISPPAERTPLAATLEPVNPIPPPWGDRPISFLRDIQPVLDRNCVSCHSGGKPAAGLDLFAGLTSNDQEVAGYGYNRAYQSIVEKGLVSISAVRLQDAAVTPPLAYGSHKSRLIQALGNKPHPEEIQLSEEDRLRLVMWIDGNAPYHDRFVSKREEPPAYDMARDVELKKQIAAVHERRCGNCHAADEISRLDWIDFRQAQRSLFLAAPLARQYGGTDRCRGGPYANTEDPDYRTVRKLVDAAVEKAWALPRRDLRALLESRQPRPGGLTQVIGD